MAKPGVSFVKADVKKAAQLGAMQARCWQAAYKDLLPPRFLKTFTKSSRTAALRRHMQTVDGAEHYLVLFKRRKVGFLVLAPAGDDDETGAGEVTALYLLPRYWGKGAGGQMLLFALVRLHAMGFTHCTLWVLEENSAARGFYAHYGFVPDGGRRVDSFGGETRVCLRYRCDIRGQLPSHQASDIIND